MDIDRINLEEWNQQHPAGTDVWYGVNRTKINRRLRRMASGNVVLGLEGIGIVPVTAIQFIEPGNKESVA